MSETDKLHYFLEASRYAFADRNVFVADPDYFRVPLRGLLSDSFAAERAALIGPPPTRTPRSPAGDPWRPHEGTGDAGVGVLLARAVDHAPHGRRPARGWSSSYTFTIESTGGNGIVVPGWGFLLNNELTDFNYDDPDAPKRPDGRQAAALVDRADLRASATAGRSWRSARPAARRSSRRCSRS